MNINVFILEEWLTVSFCRVLNNKSYSEDIHIDHFFNCGSMNMTELYKASLEIINAINRIVLQRKLTGLNIYLFVECIETNEPVKNICNVADLIKRIDKQSIPEIVISKPNEEGDPFVKNFHQQELTFEKQNLSHSIKLFYRDYKICDESNVNDYESNFVFVIET